MNTAVIGLQWGDEGKGKIIDYIAKDYDAAVRFSGGSNAGHTVSVDGNKFVFHLLPSACLRVSNLLIASGVAVDPLVLQKEVKLISSLKHDFSLQVDFGSTLVSPLDVELDRKIEEMRGASKIGTTLRGIGPSYSLRVLRVSDVAGSLRSRLKNNALLNYYKALGIKVEGYEDWRRKARKILSSYLCDVSTSVNKMIEEGGNVLFEGSQGTMLDLLHGTYPYVTGASTLSGYIAASVGIDPRKIERIIGVAKCYTTRVGSGPFPTEITGRKAEEIRGEGNEFGATTGRPRRIGWLDLPLLRYACMINGVDSIVLTKLDILTKIREPLVCVLYNYDGKEFEEYNKEINLSKVKPVFVKIEGLYKEEISGKSKGLKKLVELVEKYTKRSVSIVSYGSERKRTIELQTNLST